MPKKKKAKLVIAGPGAGKTHNMVETIIEGLPTLSPARYMAVITYTNSATENIKSRLSQKIKIPSNLFIGTIHAFMNRFIVIPFGSYCEEKVGEKKLFIQCSIRDIMNGLGTPSDPKQKMAKQAKVTERLNERGFISFDQTLAISVKAMKIKAISEIVGQRIQFLFIDEFQDTNNKVYEVIETLRKTNNTTIYAVGDPEQYITSFDSTIRTYSNIPILKAARSSNCYEVEINQHNRRCSPEITEFLNRFNSQTYSGQPFSQVSTKPDSGNKVKFIVKSESAKPIINVFDRLCDEEGVLEENRFIIAKKNDTVNRVKSALEGQFLQPTKNGNKFPLQAIRDTVLASTRLSVSEFCLKYSCEVIDLRKYCLEILYAINDGIITNEETFINFCVEKFQLSFEPGIPIKIDLLKHEISSQNQKKYSIVGNVHQIKGLETDAVLAIAKTERELILWLKTDLKERSETRKGEENDYPRIGYVAFSRAKKLLCIACLEAISPSTLTYIKSLELEIVE